MPSNLRFYMVLKIVTCAIKKLASSKIGNIICLQEKESSYVLFTSSKFFYFLSCSN